MAAKPSATARFTAIFLITVTCPGCGLTIRQDSTPISITTTPATFTPTQRPTRILSPEPTKVPYGSAFGIDYTQPQNYLKQGQQSIISDPSILETLQSGEQSLEHLEQIYAWLKGEFTTYAAQGKTIGVVTVDELLANRRLGGCHDHGLVYAAVARELGYPAIMTRTISIAWIGQFQDGNPNPHIGHVFVEVFLNGKWVLIDSTNGWYLEDGYDPANPVIPLRGSIAGSSEEIFGFYVERKGIDTWDFGIYNLIESNLAMDDLARDFDLGTIVYPAYEFKRFAR